MFGWLWRKIKRLWELAKNERATPQQIGWAIFLGVFVGCTPALGFHTVVVLAAASLFKLNRLFAWIGSRSSNALVLPFIILLEIQVAHFARTGTWASIDWRHIELEHAFQQLAPLLLDWILGTIPVGCVFGALFGLLAFRLARRRDRRKAAAAAAAALQEREQTGTIG
ncbi:MAG: DUF2062 domain-containing protein [Labilithrix sp.]